MDTERYKIVCKNFPAEFILDKGLAKEYFKQFGKLKRVTFKPKTRVCTVEYANEDGYLQALNNAGEYKGITFTISNFADEVSKETKEVTKKKEHSWVDQDEIEAELAAMAGYGYGEFMTVEGSHGSIRDSPKFVPKPKRTWKSDTFPKLKKVVTPKQNVNIHSKISTEEVDLVNLVLSQAASAEDKYKILDARDKLIKLPLKKMVAVKSKATVGTCPDMCPEKERLFREIKHQVAWYEQDESSKQMNHNKAIKQYSRSSADQEAPLTHELRPVSVLQMTMGYLLHNLVDLCDTDEGHIGEWFHFLWDRTRAIRKDITQQELCSQGAVELVEQCARFHIHCSARLVAEDPSVFDQKINTENLTKCLQTLKYMYHDLSLKEESCENEAEFRAYIILLNLNDGNFMWEVQQLRPEIQRSKEVRFALQVHSAIDKNNYVQFFKLLNMTTYLNACILMRYFVQVRIMAVKTLLKCYIPRAAKTSYPLAELQSLLAFDDLDLTIDFLQYYGLSLNDECTSVILDKNNFSPPEFPYILDRSMVIEDKREFSVGRIICGRDLPPKTYITHKIQNSFDYKGYLINKDILDDTDLEKVKLKLLQDLDDSKEDINETEMKEKDNETQIKEGDRRKTFTFGQKVASDPSVFTEEKVKHSNPFALTPQQSGSIFATKETTPQSAKSIFASPQFSFQSPIPVSVSVPSQDQPDFVSRNKDIFSTIPGIKPIIPEQPKLGGFSFNVTQPIETSNVEKPEIIEFPLSPSVPKKPHIDEDLQKKNEEIKKKIEEEEKLRLIEQKKRELKEQLEIKRVLEAKLEEARKKEIKLLEAKQKEADKKALKKKRQEEELQKRLKLLRKEELKEKEIKSAVNEVMDSLLTRVDEYIRTDKLTKIRGKIERRTLLECLRKWRFTASKTKRKRKAVDCSPSWINIISLQQSAEELHSSSQDLTLTLMKRYKYGKPLEIELKLDEEIESINLRELTYSILKNRIFELSVNKPHDIFWKVLISLPDEKELSNGLHGIEETMDNAFPWEKSEEQILYLEHVKLNPAESVTYCVEKQQGYYVASYDSKGIIFIAKNFNANLQRRIFENLKGFGVYTKVPIVIILKEYNQDDCKLEKLIKENIVSDYIILEENASGLKLVSVVEKGLVFLAKKVESDPPVELDSLKSFMNKYLCSEIWKRANSFAKWNSNYKKCLQDPNIVITLYNEGLSKLRSIILNESNKEYTVFPEEFKRFLNSETPDFLPCSYRYFPKFWKSESYLEKLEDILKKLDIPNWQDAWPPSSEHELEVSVFNYCSKLSEEPDKLFYKVMSVLLRKVDPNRNFENIRNVLWTDVIELLGVEKLNGENIVLPSEFKSDSIFNEYFVIYNINLLNNYRFCDWFYIYNPRIKKKVEEELEKPVKVVEKVTSKDCSKNLDIDADFIESVRCNLFHKRDKSKMLSELSQLKRTLEDLTDSMAVHKRISSKLEDGLKRAIAEK